MPFLGVLHFAILVTKFRLLFVELPLGNFPKGVHLQQEVLFADDWHRE